MTMIISTQILDDRRTIETTICETPPFYTSLSEDLIDCFMIKIVGKIYLALNSYTCGYLYQLNGWRWEQLRLNLGIQKLCLSDNFKDLFLLSSDKVHVFTGEGFMELASSRNAQIIFDIFGNKDNFTIQTHPAHGNEDQIFHWKDNQETPLITSGELENAMNSRLTRPWFFFDKERCLLHACYFHGRFLIFTDSVDFGNNFTLTDLTTKKVVTYGWSFIMYFGIINDRITMVNDKGVITFITHHSNYFKKTKTPSPLPPNEKLLSVWHATEDKWVFHCESGIYLVKRNKVEHYSERLRKCKVHLPFTMTF